MFDIGPSELLVILVVALLVIGPERLPTTVKTVSLWVGRFRRSFHKIKAEVERELNADEIRRQLHNESILAEVEEAKKQAKDFKKELEKTATAEQVEEETDPRRAENTKETAAKPDTKPAKDSEKPSSVAAEAGKEINQAVSYVNDISRDVKTSKEEIEKEFNRDRSTPKPHSGDKS
jgi:sec-independent protein translocase protein TatB